jgi:hypothetical protein
LRGRSGFQLPCAGVRRQRELSASKHAPQLLLSPLALPAPPIITQD